MMSDFLSLLTERFFFYCVNISTAKKKKLIKRGYLGIFALHQIELFSADMHVILLKIFTISDRESNLWLL